jgi:lysophospholipid acyltransferase (LPLAT)-like uncharacterized protein
MHLFPFLMCNACLHRHRTYRKIIDSQTSCRKETSSVETNPALPVTPRDAGESPSKRRSFFDSIRFAVVAEAGYWLIRFVCSTLTWEFDNFRVRTERLAGSEPTIYAFWHGRILPAVYYFRNFGIVVMTSRHRDGEYIAPLIRRFGFGAARGSSTRGGRSALAEMLQVLGRGQDVALTVDGPRGPRYLAKSGAVWLGAKTGFPVVPFHISHQRKWVLSSWDGFEIPKPFTRALILLANPIYVPLEATEEETAAAQRELQAALDDLRRRGDEHWNIKP